MEAIKFLLKLSKSMKAGYRKPSKKDLEKLLNENYCSFVGCSKVVYFGTESISLDAIRRAHCRELMLTVTSVAVLSKMTDVAEDCKGEEGVTNTRKKKKTENLRRKKIELARELGSSIASAVGNFIPDLDNIPIETDINYTVDEQFIEAHKKDVYCECQAIFLKANRSKGETVVFEYTKQDDVDDLLQQLEKMPGLSEAKKVVKEIVSLKQLEAMRSEAGIANVPLAAHCVLLGNPGTAKTSFAILLGKIMAAVGIVPTDKFIKVTRKDLCGKYIGETAQKVKEIVARARGGVLFIDEAYSLCGEGKDYGPEAVAELVDAMECYREDMVVIFAGYKDEMQKFLDMNSGLRSRISFMINFPDYNNEELWEIMNILAKERHYIIDVGVKDKVASYYDILRKNKGFGNGRTAREMLEKAILTHSYRVLSKELDIIPSDELSGLTVADFDEPEHEQAKRRAIGLI